MDPIRRKPYSPPLFWERGRTNIQALASWLDNPARVGHCALMQKPARVEPNQRWIWTPPNPKAKGESQPQTVDRLRIPATPREIQGVEVTYREAMKVPRGTELPDGLLLVFMRGRQGFTVDRLLLDSPEWEYLGTAE